MVCIGARRLGSLAEPLRESAIQPLEEARALGANGAYHSSAAESPAA